MKLSVFTRLKLCYNHWSSWGADQHTTKDQLKRIRLFNLFCFLWYFDAFILVFYETPDYRYFFNLPNFTHFVYVLLVAFAQWLHYKKRYTLAYSLLIFYLYSIVFIFSNLYLKGQLLEYYYVIIPVISLVFINNSTINYSVLLVCLASFVVPNLIFKIYPIRIFNNVAQPMIVLLAFIIVSYFKNLNFKNENALQIKTEELQELNKFKTQFFANISHEIRTPITLIKGYADELGEYNYLPKVKKYRKEIDNQITSIAQMVNDMLDLAKLENTQIKLKTQPFNISNLIKKLHVSFLPLFKQQHINLLVENKQNYYVNADHIYIERAINNIVLNALKYTEKGLVALALTKKKQYVQLTVTDTGIGISKEHLVKIFHRFYQVDNTINQAGGSGIGLAFSKEIIELHQGTLTVESTKGKGTTFTICLPIAEQQKETVLVEEINNELITSSSRSYIPLRYNFLLVDDTIEMRNYLKTILKEYNCFEANNGLEALQLIKKQDIDFIITDYMMPHLNGYDFIKKLQEKQYTMPVMMLTAKTDFHTKIKVLRLGIDDYLTKPFDKEELLARVRNSIKNHTVLKEYNKDHNIIIEKPANFIAELETFVFKNVKNQQLTQTFISEKLNISKSSLYRKIKTKTGMSPNEFITEIKLQKARRIFENNPDILVKQLALEVGFNHPSYFADLYEERFGIRPLRSQDYF